MKTTDTFVDKFLPFRLFKENSAFLQQVMPKEQAKFIRQFEAKRIKELYTHLIKDEEIADFKKKMMQL